MKFINIAYLFDQIELESSRTAITKLLADFLGDATPEQASVIVNLSLGQLRPSYRGTQFQFAQKNMIPVIARLLDQDESSAEKELKTLGDVGLAVASGAWEPAGNLDLVDVYEKLCHLEEIEGTGAHERRTSALLELLRALDPKSAKYIARIVVGKLRLGFSDMTIVDAISVMLAGDKSLRKDVERAYNFCADIGRIAFLACEGGIKALHDVSIQVGIPVRPAAAERASSAKEVVERLGVCVAQPKLDGFRLQIHLDAREKEPVVHFFSRNLQDMSFMFPDLAREVRRLNVETLICEGEAISYDQHTGSFLPFQETVKRKRKHNIDEVSHEFPLKIFVFDLLYLNGSSMLERTHAERRSLLMDVVPNGKSTFIQVIEEKRVETAQELEHYFVENIAAGLEGLVVKRPDAQYQPGKRNFNWIKLKRQEGELLDDTIDCVILGYYAGSGKRARFGIGAFLVGVYNPDKDRFETIAKVGTGLGDSEWIDLKKRCDAIAVSARPNNVICDKTLSPDVWVSPELVCAIRADEVTHSPVHTAGKTDEALGFALRFPRFIGYRDDKSAGDATTDEEVRVLAKGC